MSNRCRAALWAAVLAYLTCAVAAEARAEFAVRDGDRFVIYGDSITNNSPYPRFIENYVLTRFPQWKVSFVNLGWGGDRAANVGRLERDCLPLKPTLVTINLGMNDGGYTTFSPDRCKTYTDGLTRMCELLKGIGARVYLVSPITYETPVRPTRKAGNVEVDMSVYPETLLRFSWAMRDVAREQGVGYVDLNRAYAATMAAGYKEIPGFKLSGDAVHPDPNGHLVMALHILRGLGAPAEVARLTVSATLGKVTSAHRTRVWNLRATPRNVSFTRLDEALPFPVDPQASKYVDFIRFHDALNRNYFAVTGLAPGHYQLLIDGEPIAVLSRDELAQGVNLSRYENTPEMKQAHQVREATNERQAAHYEKWRKVMLPNVTSPADFTPYDLSSPRIAELDAKAAAAIQKQHALNKPVPRRYQIRPAPAQP
ncbi:MAG: SGNH/GDSL hydrolase family protein [Armatimonadota bacterium]|nr:SGNH/GDSL hydrolase family protein [Armatimonadota bacterium]